eukprot:768474-Hanusia_phi.AAC.1
MGSQVPPRVYESLDKIPEDPTDLDPSMLLKVVGPAVDPPPPTLPATSPPSPSPVLPRLTSLPARTSCHPLAGFRSCRAGHSSCSVRAPQRARASSCYASSANADAILRQRERLAPGSQRHPQPSAGPVDELGGAQQNARSLHGEMTVMESEVKDDDTDNDDTDNDDGGDEDGDDDWDEDGDEDGNDDEDGYGDIDNEDDNDDD